MDAKLVDLGFESIDYIALATFLFEATGEWLDISKISSETRIADISSYLIAPAVEKPPHKKMVKLDNWQRHVYSNQLKDEHAGYVSCIIHYLCLKEHIDLSRLKCAIEETLNNHFALNSKLIRIVDDYYFERTRTQIDFTFKGSFLFPKKDHAKLIIGVHSDRLVNIYIQRKNKQYYLIISFQHIALDGWSYTIIQEEIFRRYAGLYEQRKMSESEEICALNRVYAASLIEPSNPRELASIFELIDPYQYNKLDRLFNGKLQFHYNCFVIKKENIDQYAMKNSINDFSYDVIFSFMYYQMISELFTIDSVLIYITLSNRYLPIASIKELVANLATGLPLFMNNKSTGSRDFATEINDILRVYFKHMSFGAITRILLEKNTLLNTFLSPLKRPYCFKLTYINNTSKIVYGNDSIVGRYVNLSESTTDICLDERKQVFIIIHNMGSDFIIELYSRMAKGFHNKMVNDFFKMQFQIEDS